MSANAGCRNCSRVFAEADFDACIAYLFDTSERMVRRKEIEAIPDGVYGGESWAFYDGVTDGSRMKIKLAVTVAGDEVSFDFTGTSPQTPGFVNAPYSATASALLLTFLMLINPDIPHNAGLLRPIRIVNPEGSFLNARFPAATTFGNSITGPISDAIFRAFSQALPKMVTAGWNRLLGFAVSGQDPRHDAALRRHPVPRAEGRLGRHLGGRRLRPHRPDQLRRRHPGAGLRDVRDPRPAPAWSATNTPPTRRARGAGAAGSAWRPSS